MSQQTGFWFPSMKVSDIIRALEEWGLHVSEEQIQRPTDEVVQAIYAMFLQQITGINVSDLEVPARKAVAVLEQESDLFTDSLTLNLFLHHVRRIANAARVHDFCMADLTQPEPERTRNVLSAIINFVKFAEERGPFLKKLRDQFTAATEERERLSLDVQELRKKVTFVKDQRALEEPRCQAFREENAIIAKQLISIKTEQVAVIKETDALKQEKGELSRQKEALAREEEIVTTGINTLRSRIVQSPDRIKKHITEMGVMAQEERTKVATSENKARDLKIKLDALNTYEQEMKKIIDDLRLVHSEHVQLEDTHHKLMTFRAELERKNIFKQQSFGRVERARRQLKNAEEKLEKTRINVTDKKSHSEDELRRLKRSYEEMSEERREHDRQVEETKQAALDIERKKLEHLKQSESELNEFLAEYWSLRHQTEVYMETMANKLGIDFSA